MFYHHASSGKSQWEKPIEVAPTPVFEKPIEVAPTTAFATPSLPEDWVEALDETTGTFLQTFHLFGIFQVSWVLYSSIYG